MRFNFGDIIEEVRTARGIKEERLEPEELASIKRRINVINSKIQFSDNWEWRRKRWYFSTRAPLEAGTVSVTKGSTVVTGSGTAFSDIIKYGFLLVNDNLVKVDTLSTVTATSFRLAAGYPGETNATATYKLVFPDYLLDPDVSAISTMFLAGRELDVKEQHRMLSVNKATGEPDEATMVNRTDFTFYEENTVDVTNGSKIVTGNSTTFTSDMEGMPFKTDENPEMYTVHTVDSATQLTLRQVYNGDTGSGKSYKIAPEGSVLVRLLDIPTDVYFVEIEGLQYPRKLVNNTDESSVPNHDSILFGAIWMAVKDFDNKPVTQIQLAKQAYDDSLRELKNSSKVVKNVRWTSEREIENRRGAKLNQFDPLRTRLDGRR